jgi:hypothetical protein
VWWLGLCDVAWGRTGGGGLLCRVRGGERKVGRGCLPWCFEINNNDQRRISVVVGRLVATSLSATWHLDSVMET